MTHIDITSSRFAYTAHDDLCIDVISRFECKMMSIDVINTERIEDIREYKMHVISDVTRKFSSRYLARAKFGVSRQI